MGVWKIIQKIRTIFIVKKVFDRLEEVRKMKEKRTELWVMLGVDIITLVLTIQGLLPPEQGVKIIATLSGIYAVLRTVLKIIKTLAPLTKTNIDNQIAEIVEKVMEKTEDKIRKDAD